jgi:hypothetical protein
MLVRSWFNAALDESVGVVERPVAAPLWLWDVAAEGACPAGGVLLRDIANQATPTITTTRTITHHTIFDVLDMIDIYFFADLSD